MKKFGFYDNPNPVLAAKYDAKKMAKIDGITSAQRLTYAAMVSRLDRGVGEVMATLKATGLDEKTLIFFLSDIDGGHPGPGYFSSNHPLRGYKGGLYEGGIRVPFVVYWKNKLPAGCGLAEVERREGSALLETGS